MGQSGAEQHNMAPAQNSLGIPVRMDSYIIPSIGIHRAAQGQKKNLTVLRDFVSRNLSWLVYTDIHFQKLPVFQDIKGYWTKGNLSNFNCEMISTVRLSSLAWSSTFNWVFEQLTFSSVPVRDHLISI